jgi:hypothetical protein
MRPMWGRCAGVMWLVVTSLSCKSSTSPSNGTGAPECTSNATCSSSICDTTTGLCVECLQDSDCASQHAACLLPSHECGCTADSQCSASRPHCSVESNACFECVADSQCSGAAPSCQNGVCATPCSADEVRCGTACFDTQSDPSNCGGCDKPVPAGGTCVNGAPSCPAGYVMCTGSCSPSLQTDPMNCGQCGHVCATDEPDASSDNVVGSACVQGSCAFELDFGEDDADDSCADLCAPAACLGVASITYGGDNCPIVAGPTTLACADTIPASVAGSPSACSDGIGLSDVDCYCAE